MSARDHGRGHHIREGTSSSGPRGSPRSVGDAIVVAWWTASASPSTARPHRLQGVPQDRGNRPRIVKATVRSRAAQTGLKAVDCISPSAAASASSSSATVRPANRRLPIDTIINQKGQNVI